MYRSLRMLLPLVLVVTVGGLAGTASPAAAGTCNPDPVLTPCALTNQTDIPVVGVNAWCDGSVQVIESELMNCDNVRPDPPKAYSVLHRGETATNIDAWKADANCVTNGQGWQDRRGKGSAWVKFPDFLAIEVTDKTCYAPTGVSVSNVAPAGVTLNWDSLRYDDGSRAPVDFRVRRDGVVIYAGQGGGGPGYVTFTDDNGPVPGGTYTYTVTILYGTGYEGPAASTGPITTPGPPEEPPPPPQPTGYPANTAPSWSPTIDIWSFTLYWITTFQAGPVQHSATQVGTLYPNSWNYVYCKAWAGEVRYGDSYNHWWMWTDPDVGQSGWVSAYWLTYWGNDQALDNWGGDIPLC